MEVWRICLMNWVAVRGVQGYGDTGRVWLNGSMWHQAIHSGGEQMAAPQHANMGIANAMIVAMAAIAFNRIQEDASAANTGAQRRACRSIWSMSGGEDSSWEGLAARERAVEEWLLMRQVTFDVDCSTGKRWSV